MDSTVINFEKLPHHFYAFSKLLHPAGLADSAALFFISLLSAAYLLRSYTWDRPDPHDHVWYERPQEDALAINPQKKATRNIARKVEESGKDTVIFWGSQSGTAEGLAARLAKECHQRFGREAIAADLSDYDAHSIAALSEKTLVIFILSTYGEGDPSDNAAELWDWLTGDKDVSLPSLQYAAFGLGNSNYKYYNRVVDVVVEKLDAQGARRLLPVGKADDALHSTEEDFMTWKDDLFHHFRTTLGLREQDIKYEPALLVQEDESLDFIDLHTGEPAQPKAANKGAAKNSSIKALVVKESRELFTDSRRQCVHLELDLSDQPELTYKTGDHLAVWPINPEAEVERLLQATDGQRRGDIPLLIKSLDCDIPLKVPAPCTRNVLFRNYLEICAPISRDTIIGLAQFAPTPEARSFIVNLGQDRDTYREFARHTQLNLGRLLLLASPKQPWKALPMSWIIENLPILQPRYYSISSSSVLSPRRIAITALVAVDDLDPQSAGAPPAKLYGVTTNYLVALAQSNNASPSSDQQATVRYNLPTANTTTLYAHIRKSKFKLPISRTCPIIMVAAGTGLAPFRAFISERARLASSGPIGPMLLFFGCRHPREDHIYRDELEHIQQSLSQTGNPTDQLKIVTAYSRVANEDKVYVQDRVTEQARDVLRLLDDGANFYICGRTTMAKEVGRRIAESAVQLNGWTEARAGEWLDTLKRQGKWKEDVWG